MKIRRFLGLLMVICMCVSLAVTVFAETNYCCWCDAYYPCSYSYEVFSSTEHSILRICSHCGEDQAGGFLFERHSGNPCSKCGYYDSGSGGGGGGTVTCYHNSTYKEWYGCTWYEYCRNCGEYLNSGVSHGSTSREYSGCSWYDRCNDCGEVINSGTSHGSYSYRDWEYYSGSQHRRLYACNDCGEGSYQYASHNNSPEYYQYSSTQHEKSNYCTTCYTYTSSSYEAHSYTYGSYYFYDDARHYRTKTCSKCGYSEEEYANHSLRYGSWASYDDSQHSRTMRCSTCGLDDYQYEDHTLTYGAWSDYSETQHRRTAKCSTCRYSGYNYGDHTDANGDGRCDTCSHSMGVLLSWDYGNGTSKTTTQTVNAAIVLPTPEPTKTGHSFDGWYTARSGGSKVTASTIYQSELGTSFYARFSPRSYTITWDLGNGETETTQQTYGGLLVLPSETPQNGHARFAGWYTEAAGGAEVDEHTVFDETSDTTYYAHWQDVFSVTVPVTISLAASEDGRVFAPSAQIRNDSTGEVAVSGVSLATKNGWTLIPFATNMAHVKVDSRQIGLSINDAKTSGNGSSEQLSLNEAWRIPLDGTLPLHVEAVASALSAPIREESVLSVTFVVRWA